MAGAELQRGERFRGLLIQGVLGEGGMGVAYLASHPVLRTPLVVKTFKVHSEDDPFREAYLAARVRSPHVVGVIDAGVENGVAFVVQRYVDGIDMAELMAARAALGLRLPPDVVCHIIAHAALGLHAIHQAGVVHCDVKAENLFIDGAGDGFVGDLGVAVDPAHRRDPSNVSGTPLFLAPERWLGKPFDRRADLYALGATLHTLLAGAPPFEAPDLIALRAAHLERPYEAPAAADPRGAYLFAVAERLLEKEPRDRYASAAEVARDLETIATPRLRPVPVGEGTAQVGSIKLTLATGDLANTAADVLVSASNWQLTMHVGVAASLSKAAGPGLAEEAGAMAPRALGDVVWTGAHNLPARFVAHAVAAMAGAMCIQRCVLRVLLEADARGLTSAALPALGTGVGEVPLGLCATEMLEAIATFAALEPRTLRDVRLVLFDAGATLAFREALALFG
jgi:eukaryotic-like serine/threonine-protein kinase